MSDRPLSWLVLPETIAGIYLEECQHVRDKQPTTLTGPESRSITPCPHVQKAMAGAKNDPLLTQNLASNFNRQTISELLTNAPAGGFKK
jgi:hypothetical protein